MNTGNSHNSFVCIRCRLRLPGICVLAAAALLLLSFRGGIQQNRNDARVTYYIDSRDGDDGNSGKDKNRSWKSLSRLARAQLRPGDSVCFKRGSSFKGQLVIESSGSANHYIVITDYGPTTDPAPSFTNPVFERGNYGNCIRVRGSYVIVENLYFTGTPSYQPVKYDGDGWDVWEMGAVHLEREAEHCIVRNNEFKDCVAGIRSNGEYAVIEKNHIHDCNRLLKQWNWGPLGIWLGADHQEVRYNRIINISAVDPRIGWGPDSYGGGADGGAIEIDDARYDKTDISIHHNYSRDCQGFLEVTWTDVKQKPLYKNFRIHHNVSDDYQQFVAIWWGADCRIENNTIIRRKVNANDWGVFNITQLNARNLIRNNIVVTEGDVVIFNVGRKGTSRPGNKISNNLFFAAKGSLVMGKEGPGDAASFADPEFVNYERGEGPEDFSIKPTSPAIDLGLDLGYDSDFAGVSIPQNGVPDMGAFENRSPASKPMIKLAEDGRALVPIAVQDTQSETQKFAREELGRYLNRITGADFLAETNHTRGYSVLLQTDNTLQEEGYTISLQKRTIVLAGGSERAILFATYHFLYRLGCRWIAPQFDFYNGSSEYIPKKKQLYYDVRETIREQPQFAYRKIDIEEGRSHTIENLKQIVDWMPKVRMNILMIPVNYQGGGKVKWDNWKDALTRELRKRGLLIEVGGHGYQNFLNAKMEDGKLFESHPHWFGKNKEGRADAAQHLVFNTSDTDAVDYFTGNVLSYLKQHPEIDIFDFWPPDEARWAEAPEFVRLGSPVDRHAALVNKVNAAAKELRPGLRFEVIAYGQVLQPPDEIGLDNSVLVDICPINQNFERQIYDTTSSLNAEYAGTVLKWRKLFQGDIGIYSYYRKYAWRSLPVIIPRYIQDDLAWYASIPVQGISTYAEPGDWYTYELNHYALANLSWCVNISIDSLVEEYGNIRYGAAGRKAMMVSLQLGNIVRHYGSIPFTSLKQKDEIREAQGKLMKAQSDIGVMLKGDLEKNLSTNLKRLLAMIRYALFDLKILQMVADGAALDRIEAEVGEMLLFLESHSNQGVFLISGGNNLPRYLKPYTGRKS